jgi:biotin carboxyl carrier protein
MSGALRRILPVVLVLAGAVWLVTRFRESRRDVAHEASRDTPVVAPSRVSGEGGAVTVTLDTAEVRRIGLSVDAVHAGGRVADLRLPAEMVAETERAATLRAPVSGRFTVAEGAHWPGLGERVRAGVEIARVSDARPLAMPISGTVTRVGAQPGALVEAGQALLEVADLSRPLVRVAWLVDAGDAPPQSLVLDAGSGATGSGATARGPRVAARLVGPAPEADPVTRRPAYLYRAARSWPGAAPGVPIVALIPASRRGATGAKGDSISGPAVVVPDSAVVQWQGLAWAYRRRAPGRFERVRVATDRPVPGGWLTGPPLLAGDTVVLRGAEELLSEEFRARVTVGDESGE